MSTASSKFVQPDLPRGLIDSLLKGAVIPFVGAGVSRSVKLVTGEAAWPSWDELLERGADELSAQGNADGAGFIRASMKVNKSPLVIAEELQDWLGPNWRVFLKKNILRDEKQLEAGSMDLPRAIWALESKLVITTNFDEVLTFACPAKRPLIIEIGNVAANLDTLRGELDGSTIWHLHGHIRTPTQIILTASAYQRNYNDSHSAALKVFETLLATKTLLFIGFSFSDENIRRELEQVVETFRGLGGPHYALVRRADEHVAAPVLKKLAVSPVYFEDYGEPLVRTVQAIASHLQPESPTAMSLQDPEGPQQKLRGENDEPTPISDRWQATRAVKMLDLLGPTYILDRSYFFLDWNPAFERLFAKPLGLYRGQHAQDFIRSLVNRDLVEERSRQTFVESATPLVDVEPLFFRSPEFGLLKLWKLASRVTDESGNFAAWAVTLNIISADDLSAVWDEIKRVLEERINWSLYAAMYDKLLMHFSLYTDLVRQVCSEVQEGVVCADLGAGTGNGTIELLRQRRDRTVWAVEPNGEMLTQLKDKLKTSGMDESRVSFVKQGIERLGEFDSEMFDAAVMINVLYAVDSPAECLKEVARVMKPGGSLALSTSHDGTDVVQLFTALRDQLLKKGLYNSLRPNFEEARKRHDNMMKKIRRDSKADIRRYLEDAGFAIEKWLDDQYAGAVVVIKAVKL